MMLLLRATNDDVAHNWVPLLLGFLTGVIPSVALWLNVRAQLKAGKGQAAATEENLHASAAKELVSAALELQHTVSASEAALRERLAVVESDQRACVDREVALQGRVRKLEEQNAHQGRLIEQLLERLEPA